MKLLATEQVVATLRTLPPDHQNEIRSALRALTKSEGDVTRLEGRLAGYYRQRIGNYRIVYRYQRKHIEAVFLERRRIAYVFTRPA